MKTDFLYQLFELLNQNFPYAVLRNHDGLPETCDSRDIDILIERKDLKTLKKTLVALAEKTSCRELYHFQDHQFFSVVYIDEKLETLQLDFQYNFAWMGIDLLDEKMVLTKRIFNGKIYHLPPDLIFLPKYIYCRILGAKYPDKYSHVRTAALEFDSEGVEKILKSLSGGMDLQAWERSGKWNLRLRTFFAALWRNPLRGIGRMLDFQWCYIRDLFFRRGLMISFSGPDGCGKTTVIEMLMARLAVNPPELFHFRPTVLPNLGETAHKAGVVKEVDRNFDKPHRAKKKGILNSLIRFAYYYTDYVLGYFLKILPLRQRKHIVLFDRYFTDVIVDSERSSIFLNFKFICWMRHFVPMCRYNFIFCVEPETIRSRKQELEVEDMKRIYSRLEYLCARDKRYYKIDNNGTTEDAVRQILDVLAKK